MIVQVLFLVEDENSLDEESENSTLEKHIEIQYWFPINGDPNSVFNSQPEFMECLKHYLKISLPRFQHADIILVISHMYFREKSFQSFFLKYMLRSSVHGCSTAERLSQISESEILEISKNSRLDSSILS